MYKVKIQLKDKSQIPFIVPLEFKTHDNAMAFLEQTLEQDKKDGIVDLYDYSIVKGV